MKNDLRAVCVRVDERTDVVVTLSNSTSITFPVTRIDSFRRRREPREALRAANDALRDVRIEDDGFTIAWPQLDVDFDVLEMLPVYAGFAQTAKPKPKAARVAK